MARIRPEPSPLRAGAAQVDITPKAGIQLAGAVGQHRPARLVADPLYARALVIECNGQKLCLVSLDLTIITRQYSARIRQAAADRFGLEPGAVMVHATQTHSAPALGHFMLSDDFEGIPPEFDWLRGGDERYHPFAEQRIIEAIGLANDSLQAVQVGSASGVEGRMAFNRRAVMRDGSIGMPSGRWDGPLGPTEILYIDGPIDPEVGVLCLRTESLQFPALLVNYTCHPVHVFPKPIVSADWPGALAEALQKEYGRQCVPLVLNGPCGNINPWPPFEPHYVRDHRRMGEVLAATVASVVETLTFKEKAIVDWRVKNLKIPIRAIDPAGLGEARKVLAEYPRPVWADEERTHVDSKWVRAAGLLDLYNLQQRCPLYDYEIQVFRVGDTALVGLPGEPFVEGGLRIKLASPTYPTYVVHDVNHYVGYLPVKEAFERGGHECSTGNWSRLVPEALDIVVDAAVELLRELFQE